MLLSDKLTSNEVAEEPSVVNRTQTKTKKPFASPSASFTTTSTTIAGLSTTQKSADLPLWTWWNPDKKLADSGQVSEVEQFDDGLWENGQDKNNSVDAVINNASREPVTDPNYTETVSNRDNRNSERGGENLDDVHYTVSDNHADLIDTLDNYKENHDIINDDGNLRVSSESVMEDHETLKDKYLELMTHNTKLVDILKKTLEMQADMFRRLIRYLFP